jgi:hypothetical protein
VRAFKSPLSVNRRVVLSGTDDGETHVEPEDGEYTRRGTCSRPNPTSREVSPSLAQPTRGSASERR